jgi:outer membrane receptor protein involved in Fe transport
MDYTTPALAERLEHDINDNEGMSETNSLNYRKTYDSTDRTWTIDLAHTWQRSNGNSQTLSKAYDDAMNEIDSLDFYNRTHSYGVNQNILIKTDYNTPLKMEGSKIETGFKEELNLHDAHSDVYSNYDDPELKDTVQSAVLQYQESITAAYVVYDGRFKKLSYSGGLRWEQTYVHSDLSDVNENYASLFPSGSAQWRFNDKHNISLSYSRRINRPPFWMLNNTTTFSSPYSEWSGNPALKPSFANSMELGYNAQAGDQNTDAEQVTHTTNENAGTNNNLYTGANFSLKFIKWWSASIWAGYGYHWYEYIEDAAEYRNQGGNMNMSGNTTFKFWKNASFQLSGWGNTGWVSAQAKGKPVCGLTASVKKRFLKDKFIVSLSCRDILHTQVWRTTNFSPGLYDYSEYHYESTVAYLTLTYQFGKQTFTSEDKEKAPEGGG